MAIPSKRDTGPREPPVFLPSDLRALADLVELGTSGVLDLSEGLHQSVRGTLGLRGGAEPDRTAGVSGLVYGLLRRANAGLGQALRTGFGQLESRWLMPAADDMHARRLAALSVLNGIVGDRLAARGNPLALPFSLQIDGLPASQWLAQSPTQVSSHLLVLVHGLCMNDRQWAAAGDPGLGEALAQGFDCAAVYARYNSGLPIAENGMALAQSLEQLVAQWPRPVRRISLVGHSMGGLLARSAEYVGRSRSLRWRALLADLVLLGTPNLGAPLERIGHRIDRSLAALPYARHFARLGQIRSAGITDLRHGRLSDCESTLHLPNDVACRAIAGVLSPRAGALGEATLGDGLVPLHSAFGRAADPAAALRFDTDSTLRLEGVGHLALLRDARVRMQVADWLAATGRS
jgi:pimeloyl-ACP methyl ester carboxylesterase